MQVLTFLLQHGWDLNYTSDSGTALHMASSCGQVQTVRFLLKVMFSFVCFFSQVFFQSGIDTARTDINGLTALQLVKKNCSRIHVDYKEIRFLLKSELFQEFKKFPS